MKEYHRWWIMFLLTLITIYLMIPKSQLDIFYDPAKNTSYFAIINLGNSPIKNIKISYNLDCQGLSVEPTFISAKIPYLTESNGQQPSNIQYFDNLTYAILENANQNLDKCQNDEIIYIPFSNFVIGETNFTNEKYHNFFVYYCDTCKLKILAISGHENKTYTHTFINPVKINISISCLDTPLDFVCQFHFKPEFSFMSNYKFMNIRQEETGIYLEFLHRKL